MQYSLEEFDEIALIVAYFSGDSQQKPNCASLIVAYSWAYVKSLKNSLDYP